MNIEKIKPSGIFTNYIYKAIPLAFDESMSYYETLCALLARLKGDEEVVNNNADLLAELESYVKNYFENLDVQEEINNKLDEMVESGELENIISEYIELATTYAYANVSVMQEATNLINGSYAKTYGFYSVNDGGSAYYRIRTITNEDTVDNITIIALADETLIAELIKSDTMNVKQFGAKGDNENNDTANIQKAIDYNKNIIISEGTYLVDAENGIKVNSDNHIIIDNATVKAIANDLETYYLFDISNVQNIIIEGNGLIEGDKTTHTGLSGEHGHCINIDNESENITIKDLSIEKGWGDGVYVGSCQHVTLNNLKIDNNRRNGISVTDGEDIKIINCNISNTSGTDPQSAIDIEPNNADTCKDILIDGCYIYDNTNWGITSANNYYGTYPNAITNIQITNNKIINSKTGIRPEYIVNLIIDNNEIISNETLGINANHTNNAIISNNKIIGNGYALNLYVCDSNLISNNILSDCTTTNPVINLQGGKYNKIINNKIINNQRGVNITSTVVSGNTVNASYNRIEGNDIYDNTGSSSGTYHNISLNNTSTYNYIKDNNFVGVSNNCGYNFYAGAATVTNNIIANNIMVTQTTGDNYLRSNLTLDNIIDNALVDGTMRG